MPFQKIIMEKLSSSVIIQIEKLILQGILRPGDRLPSERELAERFGVSRPSLREAIASLDKKGLLVSKANSGIFVADVLGNAFSPALIELFSSHEESIDDYITFRRDLEGLAAERTAKHGSSTDLQVIQTIFDKMEAAHQKRDPTDEARLDADFHLSIIEASHNVIMLHMMRSMYELLRNGVFYNRQKMFQQRTTRFELLTQHEVINIAIQKRDPDAARKAVETHLDYVAKSQKNLRVSDKNEKIAKQRFEHEKLRH